MALGKRRRRSPEWALPADVLLEVVALSELTTLVRCAAACKSLRRAILDPSFLGRTVTGKDDGAGIIPRCILAYLHNGPIRVPGRHNQNLELPVSLIHPVTPAVSSFTDGNLAPYMLRCAAGIHGSYTPIMSRGGLVVLRRPHTTSIGSSVRRMSERCYDLCVFNPLTGDRTYLSCRCNWFRQYVLLTDADGIDSSFLLLATNVDMCNESGGFRITVQATNPGGTSWGPVTSNAHSLLPFRPLNYHREPVVLHGGIIHWLLWDGDQVFTYDIRTQRLGMVKLPPTNHGGSERLLGTSPDGRRLRLLVVERFMVSIRVQLLDGWVKEAVIDVEQELQSLHPHISVDRMNIEFMYLRERSGVVLLDAYRWYRLARQSSLIVLDLETKEMRKPKPSNTSLLFEVDLSMRLQAMKKY